MSGLVLIGGAHRRPPRAKARCRPGPTECTDLEPGVSIETRRWPEGTDGPGRRRRVRLPPAPGPRARALARRLGVRRQDLRRADARRRPWPHPLQLRRSVRGAPAAGGPGAPPPLLPPDGPAGRAALAAAGRGAGARAAAVLPGRAGDGDG